jgi:hypothetical protein
VDNLESETAEQRRGVFEARGCTWSIQEETWGVGGFDSQWIWIVIVKLAVSRLVLRLKPRQSLATSSLSETKWPMLHVKHLLLNNLT